MKTIILAAQDSSGRVAPLVGAWIEIIKVVSLFLSRVVVTLGGAWIEITVLKKVFEEVSVASLVGAWIEILLDGRNPATE